MDARELKSKYFEFFKEKGHSLISSASLIPEHDPTVLFTTAGMHPLVPFLMGSPHPKGKRLCNVQKCIRTGDIDTVGDAHHLTFFEMLGNWSLGDYFKKEAIEYSFEFLTSRRWLGFDKSKISVTVFAGDDDAPRDDESAKIWESLGIPKGRIHYMPKKDNWWGPAGKTGPCGPDTEMFIDTEKPSCSKDCSPGCPCGKYFEIWNDVFMQYNKREDGHIEPLKDKNVDTGMGVERTIAMLQGRSTVYETEIFAPVMKKLKELSSSYDKRSAMIIADHIRASVFILADTSSVVPSNLDQGYILRRFIRRSIRHGRLIGIQKDLCATIAKEIIKIQKEDWPELEQRSAHILAELQAEEARFLETIEKGMRKFEQLKDSDISGKDAFLLFQSYGFPLEMVKELAEESGHSVDSKGFEEEYKKHQDLSRHGAEKRFRGGLADSSEETTKLHTATHLLNEALRKVLGREDIYQKGSNITPERLRFDFNFDRKLTPEEKRSVEGLVNEKISQSLPVEKKEMTLQEARAFGAKGVFEDKYQDKVFVYVIGDFSKEICGGPHVKNTSELGHFRIKKEESSSSGVRRIKAILG